ncbi:MAG: indolepyruvate oxidoreductase subunit beta [Candidatus Methanosuratincola sp.]
MSFNIFICGVGGQGLVLLTNVLGRACLKSGFKAITGEMYGLSQRSGSVSVHMRIGDDAYSPLIPVGEGDVLVALEAIEALRYIEYLKKGGLALVNRRVMHPPVETAGLVRDRSRKYFSLEDVVSRLRSYTGRVAVIDALAAAKEAGNPNAENTVFLGCLSALRELPLDPEKVREAIAEAVPERTVDQNLRAFELGRAAAREALCGSGVCRD